jgi:uncharacterized cupredoxin-like copper-binding protein
MRNRTGTRLTYLVAIGLIAGSLAACGDDNESSSSSSDTTESTAATDQTAKLDPGDGTNIAVSAVEKGSELAFSKKSLSTKQGLIAFKLTNPSKNQLPHALEIEGRGIEKSSETIQPGGDSTLSIDLAPGKYEFYCPVGNHKQQGMEGTLTVK